MTTFDVPVAERALDQAATAFRDQIVLSAAEVANAYETALTTPLYALSFLAEQDAAGRKVSPRTRARMDMAARIVVEHGLASVLDEKPEPVVTHTTTVTTRKVSPAVQRDVDGNRFVEAADSRGGFRASFVEREDGSDVQPMVLLDLDSEYGEQEFAMLVAHLTELVREIDPTDSLRFAAERAVQA